MYAYDVSSDIEESVRFAIWADEVVPNPSYSYCSRRTWLWRKNRYVSQHRDIVNPQAQGGVLQRVRTRLLLTEYTLTLSHRAPT